MAVENRDTLKGYFRTGFKPTESNFTNLIDTLLVNKEDLFVFKEGKLRLGDANDPRNDLDIVGNLLVGGNYANDRESAPSNGLLVEGAVGIGLTSVSPNTKLEVTGNTKINGGLSMGSQAVIDDQGNWVGPTGGLQGDPGDSYFDEKGNTVYINQPLAINTDTAFAELHINARTNPGLLISHDNESAPGLQLLNSAASGTTDGVQITLQDSGNLAITNGKSGSLGELSLSAEGDLTINGSLRFSGDLTLDNDALLNLGGLSSDKTLSISGFGFANQGSGTLLSPADPAILTEEDGKPFEEDKRSAATILGDLVVKQFAYSGALGTEDDKQVYRVDAADASWPAELAYLKQTISAVKLGGADQGDIAALDAGELIHVLVRAVQELHDRLLTLEAPEPDPDTGG